MDTGTIIAISSLATNIIVGGGVLRWYLKYRTDNKQIDITASTAVREQERLDFNTLLNEVRGQRDEAWRKIEAQSTRMTMLEAEINGLRIARDLDPFPNWVVDLQGEYIYVNREFERYFCEPDDKTYRDVIGKRHEDLWPEAFCKTLQALDLEARARPDGKAKATTKLVLPGLGSAVVTVHKFPVRFKDVIVAYAGFMTDIAADDTRIGQPHLAGKQRSNRGKVYDQEDEGQ